MRTPVLVLIFCLLFAASLVSADKKKLSLEEETVQSALKLINTTRSVGDRKHPTISFVLGYASPWNKAIGYEMAIKFSGKVLSHVSPVWYDVEGPRKKPQKGTKQKAAGIGYTINGESNYNKTFVEAVVKGGAAMVPRFRFNLGTQQLSKLLEHPTEQKKLLESIRPIFERHSAVYSGLVLDSANIQFSAPGMDTRIASLIRILRSGLSDAIGKPIEVIVVIPADHDMAGPSVVEWLAPLADHLSLMTYDFNKTPKPGFLAPLHWVEKIVSDDMVKSIQAKPSKMLVGLPFYGYSYGTLDPNGRTLPSPIKASEYQHRLRQKMEAEARKLPRGETKIERVPLEWDPKGAEHAFEVYIPKKGLEVVFYPTRAFIKKRLQFIERKGLGVSIWELGQGMDAFMHMF